MSIRAVKEVSVMCVLRHAYFPTTAYINTITNSGIKHSVISQLLQELIEQVYVQ